ncbi:MAG: sulfite exporter TauE/SafE family protein [Pseudomonadota bacterium]
MLLLILALIAAGVASGFLAGLAGIGGGIVTVPVLEFILEWYGVPSEFRMQIAVATALAIIIPTSVSSARAHHLRGAVDLALVRQWGWAIGLGAIIGVLIASRLDGTTLAAVFAAFAILVAVKMALPLDNKVITDKVPGGLLIKLLPMSIGAFSSMMGIGGGTLTVPSLTLMGKKIHRAVGTSALFGLLIAIPGTIAFVAVAWGLPGLPPTNWGYVNLAGFAVIAPAAVLSAPLGARVAHSLSHRSLSGFFGAFLLVVAVRMLLQAVSG